MDYTPISKPPLEAFTVKPNLRDWKEAREQVTWEQIRSELDGTPDGGLNTRFSTKLRECRQFTGGRRRRHCQWSRAR